MDISLDSQSSAADFHDHRVIWFAVVTSVLVHFFALAWWPVNWPVAERFFFAVTEFNIELVNLALLPEPDNFLRPLIPEVLPEVPLSVDSQNTSDESFLESGEAAELVEDNIVSSRPLRFDALSIHEAVSSVELSSDPNAGRSIPANENTFPEPSGVIPDSTYINAQGNNVVIVDGQCFIVPALADDITHGKQVAMQMGGGGCPYVPSRSEKLLESVMDRVCSKFHCD